MCIICNNNRKLGYGPSVSGRNWNASGFDSYQQGQSDFTCEQQSA